MRTRRRAIPVGGFDAASGLWRATDSEASAWLRRDRLTVATFNIWFNEFYAPERYRAICDVLARNRPDVMVFQEVTPQALTTFLDQPWIREHYRRAEFTGDGLNYGMLLLSRLPVNRVTYASLPTRLDRGFLVADFTVNAQDLRVAAIHLESGKAASGLRARQLRMIFRSLRRSESALVLGDFNMRDTENGIISRDYRDVWPTLRPDDDGFTEDTSINLMRYDMKNKHRHVRFDRVLVKGDQWVATHIELLGTKPIDDALPRVFPSDHFGVLCRFEHRPAVAKVSRGKRLWVHLRN